MCVVIRLTGFIFGSNYILGTFSAAASCCSAGDLVTLSPLLLFLDYPLIIILIPFYPDNNSIIHNLAITFDPGPGWHN